MRLVCVAVYSSHLPAFFRLYVHAASRKLAGESGTSVFGERCGQLLLVTMPVCELSASLSLYSQLSHPQGRPCV